MKRAIGLSLVIVGLAVVLLTAGALAGVSSGDSDESRPTAYRGSILAGARRGNIDALQERLRAVPNDDASWAGLGLAYIERATATADPAFYPKAEGALKRSLRLQTTDNFVAAGGMAALANARHDFTAGRDWARKGLAINPANPALYGTLVDAETQLGRYPEAFAATQRMIDLSPDTASLSRASYSWELRGDLVKARELMQRALSDALSPTQRAFTRYYLGELALTAGDAEGALVDFDAGMQAAPTYAPLLEGRARAEIALGRTDEAVRNLADAVQRRPELAYVMLYGELLESLGRQAEADQQYAVFRAEQRLFEANGVVVDVEAALFEANHGNPQRAVEIAQAGLHTRPFLDMHDAHAWALHRAGRDTEALAAVTRALSLGTRNALFEFHAGMIENALGNAKNAERHLRSALAINAGFHPLHAPAARATLSELARP